jgi:hypothetical protein
VDLGDRDPDDTLRLWGASPLDGKPISGRRVVTMLLIGYVLFWGLLWAMGKKGPDVWHKLMFPNEP